MRHPASTHGTSNLAGTDIYTTDLAPALSETLPLIDAALAREDHPLTDRPLQAAITFVRARVTSVSVAGQETNAPGEPGQFLAAEWFAELYAGVHAWYRDRYGAAFDHRRDDRLQGATMIAGTPFAMRIPKTRSRPGLSGDTEIINFPDRVRSDEQPLEWIVSPPNFERFSVADREEAAAQAFEVADALRFIRTGLISVGDGNAAFDGFTNGIMPRLYRAAEILLDPDPDAVQHAYWEMQLACEHALKALQARLTGSFTETHDLFRLYDAPVPAPAFSRDVLRRFPRWRENNERRYGQGVSDGRAQCFAAYRTTLVIVAGSVRSMPRQGLGDAEFEIRRLPWTQALPGGR